MLIQVTITRIVSFKYERFLWIKVSIQSYILLEILGVKLFRNFVGNILSVAMGEKLVSLDIYLYNIMDDIN